MLFRSVGAAIGLAILVAVASWRTKSIVSEHGDSLMATTSGFQTALGVGAGFAALGVLVTTLTLSNAHTNKTDDKPFDS